MSQRYGSYVPILHVQARSLVHTRVSFNFRDLPSLSAYMKALDSNELAGVRPENLRMTNQGNGQVRWSLYHFRLLCANREVGGWRRYELTPLGTSISALWTVGIAFRLSCPGSVSLRSYGGHLDRCCWRAGGARR